MFYFTCQIEGWHNSNRYEIATPIKRSGTVIPQFKCKWRPTNERVTLMADLFHVTEYIGIA